MYFIDSTGLSNNKAPLANSNVNNLENDLPNTNYFLINRTLVYPTYQTQFTNPIFKHEYNKMYKGEIKFNTPIASTRYFNK